MDTSKMRGKLGEKLEKAKLKIESQICTGCGKRKSLAEFHRYLLNKTKLGKWCEDCYQREIGHRLAKRRAYGAMHRARKHSATPIWADRSKIKRIYKLADIASKFTGHKHQVEHWVPLKSNVVCGLHWERNLRIAPADLNQIKGNRFAAKDSERVAREGMVWLRENGLV